MGERRKGMYARKSLVVLYAVIGVLGAVLFTLSLLNPTMRAQGALPLALGIWLAIWYSTTPIVEAFGDHVTFKAAPLAGRKTILFSELRDVDERSRKKAFAVVEIDGKRKSLRLPLYFLEPADASKLVALLRSHVTT